MPQIKNADGKKCQYPTPIQANFRLFHFLSKCASRQNIGVRKSAKYWRKNCFWKSRVYKKSLIPTVSPSLTPGHRGQIVLRLASWLQTTGTPAPSILNLAVSGFQFHHRHLRGDFSWRDSLAASYATSATDGIDHRDRESETDLSTDCPDTGKLENWMRIPLLFKAILQRAVSLVWASDRAYGLQVKKQLTARTSQEAISRWIGFWIDSIWSYI